MYLSFRRPRTYVALAAAAAAAFVAIPLATPASAGGGEFPMPLYGEVECNEDYGMNGIIWELQNNTGETVTIESAELFGALEGNEREWTITELPADVPSFAFTIVPVGVTGDISLAVHTSWFDGEEMMEADSVATVEVDTCGDVPDTTTTSTTAVAPTSTAAPTTVAVAPAAVTPVVATPHFTG